METTEEWRDIVGWEGIYAVSDLGRFKRITQTQIAPAGRLLKPSLYSNGYTWVRLRYRGRVAALTAHHAVMAAFVGPRLPKMQVNHKDGNRDNNVLTNLEYLTCSENHLHAFRVLGRKCSARDGELNSHARLTAAQVNEIRALYRSGMRQVDIAARYDVTQVHISSIITGKSWKSLIEVRDRASGA